MVNDRRNPCRRNPTVCVAAGARHGFTLVELLIVIAVIALLAALLFPAFASARNRAWQTTCLSNQRQIGQAQLLYLQDHDERFPDWFFPGPPRPEPHGKFVYWTEFFQGYLRSEAVLRCAKADWIWEMPEGEKLAEYVLGTWGRGGQGTRQSPHWNWPGASHTLASVRRPAETIAVIDGFTTGGWTSVHLVRHHGGSNAGFVDGHARWLTAGEFWAVAEENGAWHMRYAAVDR